ncbi:MAG TPA: FmdB family zinc ribbon protein [Methylomirabilota bacterium]|jgi:putative FmdB family regulatory protein|nr:FmdB family zinc ribbon protein [Methylomirabilota bacterium]
MPIYEYYCLSCDLTFELLTSLSESTKKKPCPECGRKAPRTVSAFAIASGGNGHQEPQQAANHPQDPRPLCMKYPQVPLSCHMDEPSLKRFVAHMRGRGAEYDDKQAAAAELRKQRGIPEPVVAPPAHGHDHHYFRRHGASQAATQNNTSAHAHGHGRSHTHDHGLSHKKGKSHSHVHAHGAHAQ